MVVVRHDDGYTLVELLGDEGALAVGDAVSGDWDSLGDEPVYSRGCRYEAYFQGTWGSPDPPMRMARNIGG
jgi:hypothetical protein